jgi:hypothetical protein
MKATANRVASLTANFRSVFAASLLIAALALAIPFGTAPGAMDEAIRVSALLTLVWFILLAFAFVKFKWRAFWLLLGMPLTGYWFFVLYLIASGCAHNVKNCP